MGQQSSTCTAPPHVHPQRADGGVVRVARRSLHVRLHDFANLPAQPLGSSRAGVLDWLHGPYRLSSIAAGLVVAPVPGVRMGYADRIGCCQLVFRSSLHSRVSELVTWTKSANPASSNSKARSFVVASLHLSKRPRAPPFKLALFETDVAA
jgi:hypothetical protein